MTTVTRWNPFREFDELFAQFGSVPAAARTISRAKSRSAWVPAVDISETEAAYLIELDIPAVPIDAVSVQVKDGLLSISGERRHERAVSEDGEDGDNSGRGPRRHRVERQYGRFARSFQLPEDADEEAIEATARDGVLTLAVSKREKASPRQIEVKVH
ncbi:MAG: Hsp20/alpha crystallin family protein [Pseudomonadota bacterium]